MVGQNARFQNCFKILIGFSPEINQSDIADNQTKQCYASVKTRVQSSKGTIQSLSIYDEEVLIIFIGNFQQRTRNPFCAPAVGGGEIAPKKVVQQGGFAGRL